MAASGDPVAMGIVESLARPGGNVTGLSQMAAELAGKRLEMLKEMYPKLSRVAVIWNPPQDGAPSLTWKALQLAARQLGAELHSLEVRNLNDFDKAFDDAIRTRAGAIYIIATPVIVADLKRIADFAVKGDPVMNINDCCRAGAALAPGNL